MRAWSGVVALVLVLPLLACGSSPAPAATGSGAPAAAKAPPNRPEALESGGAGSPAAGAQPPAPPEPYTYEAAGRRDPFVDLLKSGAAVDPKAVIKRGEGAAGLAVNEIVVRAIVQINGRNVAMIQGPDGRNFNIHQGDKLADGMVTSVTREGLVIVQEVNDPLSTAKQREVRKLLRSLEDSKQ